ncbi:hypothetical protein L596_022128 [Steinernema carpocapsae]|uniref:Uncharacterized protein n=1 Tax=Steinernema carpocapsae TaxID=34508 RepID=A0A4U5MKV0_STECR|nr:hypothetical protein L596_022128 [Steinernema carpocapsae]
MKAFLLKHEMEYEVMLMSLGDMIRHGREVLANRTVFKHGEEPSKLTLKQFYINEVRLNEIYAYLNSVAATYSKTVSTFNLANPRRDVTS